MRLPADRRGLGARRPAIRADARRVHDREAILSSSPGESRAAREGTSGRDLIRVLQQGAAVAAVRDSVVRGTGAAAATAWKFCASLDLAPFAQRRGGSFLSRLDVATERLRRTLPAADRSWGAARSVIDRFMREALYNRYLCARFRLERAETWLELPLDPIVARRLRSAFPESGLPPWRDLRSLTPAVNSNYQGVAAEIAERKGIARVHLGTILSSPSSRWRQSIGG